MSVATFASRGIGFVRVWVIAAVLGTTYLGNTFQASNSVSNVLFELLAAGALSAVLVPTFVEHLRDGDDAEAERLASGVLGLALVVMGVVSVIGIVLAPQIARVLSSGAPNSRVEARQIELSTFLLRFFIPQVMLYAVGTVATAVLYAKRRFVITAIAPIANTVVLVAALLVFRAMHGSHPDLDLTDGERLVLALGGTLGVVGFTGVPTIALLRSGFRLRASLGTIDRKLRRLLWLSAWVALQPDVAVLLGAAIVMGNRVAGGVVAYQFCFVAFLAPYAILAQPLATTILPELTVDVSRNDMAAFAERVRWALNGMAKLLLPVSAAYVALAEPAMRVVSAGNGRSGVDLFRGRAGLAGRWALHLQLLPAARARVLRVGRQPDPGVGRGGQRAARRRGHGGRRPLGRQRHRPGRRPRPRAQRRVPRRHARARGAAAPPHRARLLPARTVAVGRVVGCARWARVVGRRPDRTGGARRDRRGAGRHRARRCRCLRSMLRLLARRGERLEAAFEPVDPDLAVEQ